MYLEEAAEILGQFMQDEQLARQDDSFLLAVSGGKDSMAMLEVFAHAGLKSVVAHMNFSLRGEESDEDARFVRTRCLQLGIPCFVQKVDCRAYASNNGLNIQSAARELRYAWFNTLLEETSSDHICTAHHQDDAIETLFINLIRGTGVRGLSGIPLKRGKVIRPMMCFERSEINACIEQNRLAFREDSSNASTRYLRNKIRHHLIPMLDEVHLGSRKVLFDNIRRFREHMDAFRALESASMQKAVRFTDESVVIDLPELKKVPAYAYLFRRLGRHYGFSTVQCTNLLESDRPSGTHFQSHTHEMIRDRNEVVIREVRQADGDAEYKIDLYDLDREHLAHGGQLLIEEVVPPVQFDEKPHTEFIDAGKVGSELTLRKWMPGDKLVPLGMTGQKKVSDILTDRKLSLFDKEGVYVLTSNGKIVWLVGLQLSEEFKVTNKTRRAYRLEWSAR